MYEQMSAEERYKDAHDILAPIENSYKQLEHYMDENGSCIFVPKTIVKFRETLEQNCVLKTIGLLLCYTKHLKCYVKHIQ